MQKKRRREGGAEWGGKNNFICFVIRLKTFSRTVFLYLPVGERGILNCWPPWRIVLFAQTASYGWVCTTKTEIHFMSVCVFVVFHSKSFHVALNICGMPRLIDDAIAIWTHNLLYLYCAVLFESKLFGYSLYEGIDIPKWNTTQTCKKNCVRMKKETCTSISRRRCCCCCRCRHWYGMRCLQRLRRFAFHVNFFSWNQNKNNKCKCKITTQK